MKINQLIALALITLGIVIFASQGVTLITREKVVGLAPTQVTTEEKRTLPLLPIVGGIALVGGIVLLRWKSIRI